jgi:predicted MPP superfamily phosphohydrolase
MTDTLEDRSLAERLKGRIEREEEFARTGRKLRNKSWLFRHEKVWMRPLIKFGLQTCGLYGRGRRNALCPVIRHLRLVFDNLPPAFEGYTLLHLSDFHIDGVPGIVAPLGRLLRDLSPDLCVLTGDYRFDDGGACERIYPLMQSILQSISAPDGVFGILGNHDAAEIALTLDKMGICMLINDAVEIRRGTQSIWVAGVDDPFDYQCDDLPGALQNVPADAFKILLAHTPELYEPAVQMGVNLYLSGHTHAGQVRFPVVGSIRNNADCPSEYAYGHWRHKTMHGYTSAGVGCSSLPIRFNCPPEAVLIRLSSRS